MKIKKTIKIISTILILLIVILLVLYKTIDNGITEYYSQYWVSHSIQDSENENLLVYRLLPNKKTVLYKNNEILFDEVWIEKVSKIKYEYLFFKRRQILNSYRLVLTLEKPIFKDSIEIPFALEEKKGSFAYSGYNSKEIYHEELLPEEINKDTIKVSLVNKLSDKRKYQIYFTKY